MKIIRYFLSLSVLIALATGCTLEKFEDLSFVENAALPANLSAIFDITQDNSGLVTITPLGEGASYFAVHFGDNTVDPDTVLNGQSTQHIYAEGVYSVKIVATGNAGQTSEEVIPLTVSFRVPENIEISVENDLTVSKQVNISATADYSIAIDVYFGELTEDVAVTALPGETISHIYENPGDYEITVVAKSGGIETLDSTFTFTVTEIIGPATAAPTPSARNATDVISIFSEAYTDLAGTDFNPNWGQSTVVSTIDIGGNGTLKYSNLNYQGTAFTSLDASAMDYLHVDVWTDDATTLNFFCISTGPAEKAYSFAITTGVWVSYDIPLTHYSDVVDLADIFQFKVDGTGGSTVYFDNIYFYRDAPTSPTTSAPTPPALTPDKVISIFSEAYTSVAGTDFNPNWGQSTIVTTEEVTTGDNIMKYANLNYQGTSFTSAIDASSMGYLHIDMWTYDATAVNISCISTGPLETAYALPITAGQWVSYDIPLTKFSTVVDLTDIIQFKFDGTEGSTIYLDNIYFH